MAIPFTPDDVASGFNLTKINGNFDKVDVALQDALSRSGNGPNQMEADIDLNSNDLLNVNTAAFNAITIGGVAVIPSGTVQAGQIATQVEAETGTDNIKIMTPLRVKQSIASQVGTTAGKIAAGDDSRIVNALQPGAADSNLNFVQAGTGAVTRTTRDKERDFVNAADFGVSTSASASANRAAFQLAIDYAKSIKCKLIVNPGTYSIDAALDVSECSDVSIIGNGSGSIISTTSATLPIIQATGVTVIDGFHLRDIKLTSSVTRTGTVPFIQIDPMIQFSSFTDVVADNYNSFMWLKQFIEVRVRDCKAYQMTSPPLASFGIKAGTQAGTNQGANLYLRDSILRGKGSGSATSTDWTVGLILYDVEGIFTDGLDIADFDMNALGDPQTRLANCFFDSSFFDATQRGPCFRLQGTGIKVEMKWDNSWFASAGRSGTPTAADGAYGFSAIGTGAYGRIQFDDCEFLNTAGNGVNIVTTAFPGTFEGCTWYACSLIDSGPAFFNNTSGIAPDLKTAQFTGNGGTNCVSYSATSTAYVVADVNADQTLSLLGTPNRVSDIVATNSVSIASAAALDLVPFHDTQTVTGTTTITSINASWPNRTVQLLFASGLTVTHGANLVLKGAVNAMPASGGIMTFFYNGSGQWREVSRNF